ncbi:hypothetical protein SAMN05421504_103678 [Amycolatopsis xylanica]|uniref:Lipoprotein n=1 Tax=Amycolatopsis xylanica TaxID=589385 RepID=A0A1H3E7K6_9PSEU|nr:hypothetical protein [Amycolatopsis xylanica]SDX74228.1 hypothetical protein SAMN05421504_103678 [Amycolatopsis xylanica]
MRKAALVAGGAALVLALTACGGKTDGNGSAAPAPGGEQKDAISALFSDPIQLADAAKAGTEKSKSAKFTMETAVGGMTMKGSGQASYENGDPKMSMTMDMMGAQVEMRVVDKIIYMKLPESLRAKQGITTEWTKVSVADAAKTKAFGGTDPNELLKQNDPSKFIEQLKTAGTIKKSEKTTLDGQPANHYSVDLDFAKMKDLMPSGIPAEATEQLNGKNFILPMELFVNSDNLPIKIEMDMGPMMKELLAGSPQAQQMGEMKMIAKYTDWGAPVDVQAPPADKVSEMPKK